MTDGCAAIGDGDGVAAVVETGGGALVAVTDATVAEKEEGEDAAEGCATVEPLMLCLAAFLVRLLAAVGLCLAAAAVSFNFEAAAVSLRAILASLYFSLQS